MTVYLYFCGFLLVLCIAALIRNFFLGRANTVMFEMIDAELEEWFARAQRGEVRMADFDNWYIRWDYGQTFRNPKFWRIWTVEGLVKYLKEHK